jgi:hypothetical protein
MIAAPAITRHRAPLRAHPKAGLAAERNAPPHWLSGSAAVKNLHPAAAANSRQPVRSATGAAAAPDGYLSAITENAVRDFTLHY